MDIKENIFNEAKRIEEDTLHSSRAHFTASRIWGRVHFWIGLLATILAAGAGASLLSESDKGKMVAGILALVVTALTSVLTFVNPEAKSNNHLKAGNHYNSLRNGARIFYNVTLKTATDQEAAQKLAELNITRDKFNEQSPAIPYWAFRGAKKSIDRGETDYKVDKAENV